MVETHNLSNTDASNTARFPEGMAPSSVNDGARALEGMISRWFFDTQGPGFPEATVSGSVIQFTCNRVSITMTGTSSNYIPWSVFGFRMGATPSTDGVSIRINDIQTLSLRDNRGQSLSSSAIPAGSVAFVMKDDTQNYFRLLYSAHTMFNPKFAGQTDFTNAGGVAQLETTNGALLIGSTSIMESGRKLVVQSSTAAVNVAQVQLSNAVPSTATLLNLEYKLAAPDNNSANFLSCSDTGAQRARIYSDGDLANHDGTYGSLSSKVFKPSELITPATDQWTDVKALSALMVNYETTISPGKRLLGWVAEDVAKVSPGVVRDTTWQSGGTVEDAKFIDDMTILKKGFRALGQALLRIEALEARVTTLEGK